LTAMMKMLYALETDVNKVKAEVDKQLTVNNKDITDMSAKIIIHCTTKLSAQCNYERQF